jgi:PTS system fructose-specific IIC component
VVGAVAGLASVKDAVRHGGPIVAVLGAVGGVPMFSLAIAVGTVVTALTTNALIDIKQQNRGAAAGVGAMLPEPVLTGVGAASSAGAMS